MFFGISESFAFCRHKCGDFTVKVCLHPAFPYHCLKIVECEISDVACNLDNYLKYVTYPGGFPALEKEIQVIEVEEQDYIG